MNSTMRLHTRTSSTVTSAALLAIAATLTACKSVPPPAETAPTVPVATASPATLENNLMLTAEFRPYQDVDVMAKVAGYVRSIRVDIGDHVHTGEVLATLDVPEMQNDVAHAKASVSAAEANVVTAQAAVERARASANIAQLSAKRIQDVAAKDKGLVPQQDIDVALSKKMEAEAQLASAQSAVKAAQDTKSGAEQEYQRSMAMLDYATIRAPFNGVVTKRYANTGAMVQAGTASQSAAMPVVRVAQDNLLRLILPVPVTDVPGIQNGQVVDVNVAGVQGTIKGKVTRYADAIATSTRTMDTEVDVPNPDGKLVPGMYAEVHLHLAARPDVLSVPLDAVEGLGTSVLQVYAVRDGVVHLVPVQVGLQTATRVEIVSGLHAGDKVIVGRHTGLSDGQHVNAVAEQYEATR